MNKLNEIEVRAAVIALPAHPLSGKIQSDFDLLIRAVRQLGAGKFADDERWIRVVAIATMISDTQPSISRELFKILDEARPDEDPDVLELIEETQ